VADLLARHLRVVIGDSTKVQKLMKTVRVTVFNIPDWLDEERVIEDVRATDENLTGVQISVGENLGGGRVAIFTTSLMTAIRLKEAGSIRIGLGCCQLRLVKIRQTRCYRRQQLGHVTVSCTVAIEEKKCYHCQMTGHNIAACQGKPARAGIASKVVSDTPNSHRVEDEPVEAGSSND